MRVSAPVVMALLLSAAVQGRQEAAVWGQALAAAVKPALPFPDAADDGTAPGGDPAPVWTVRWSAAGNALIEVLANPLNPDNRQRALKAEEAIQKAAMQSQQRSQADYDKAVVDFQKTGRVSDIREISLRDDGLAGERYDAESQLAIEARTVGVPYRFTLATSRLPQAFPAAGGPTAIVRVAANEYQESGEGTQPPATHFCAEQAWVFFGPVSLPVVSAATRTEAAIAIGRADGTAEAPVVVVSIRGNVELVDRVLQRADWALFRSRLGG